MNKKRCPWLPEDNALYKEYHDTEWGVPLYDDQKLFEMLILEGAQAGLNWFTILKRRHSYRQAYDQFNPEKMASWSQEKMDALLLDKGIIRNRLKILSAHKGAQAYLRIQEEEGSFSSFIWSFVGGAPIINHWENPWDIPVETEESIKMSKALKKKGFTFVGPTICYAYMQAVGMVNDHTVDCFRYDELTSASKA